MARMDIIVDVSDLKCIVKYVAHATETWTPDRRESRRLDMLTALEHGIQVHAERGGFTAEANAELFAVLNRYCLNPVV